MKKFCLLAIIFALSLSVKTVAQETGLPKVTLYAPNKYEHSFRRALFNFEMGALAPGGERWDLNYGALYVGEDHDWFSVSTIKDSRSVIKDLGALHWTDSFEIPIVEPFPKLKEGQTRTVTIDSSGADGADGLPGKRGADGIDGDGRFRGRLERPDVDASPAPARREKRSGVPKVDPIFVKAVVGHMYVIHVVDGDIDYYALFRVEALERGDNCTISWKLIPPPESETRNQQQ